MKGRVVSTKMNKTAVVVVERRRTHRKYKKSFLRTKKYLVHDELGVQVGDLVELLEIRPISKNKFLKVSKVIGRDVVVVGTEGLKEATQEVISEVIRGEAKKEDGGQRAQEEKQEVLEKLKKKDLSVKVRVRKKVKKGDEDSG